MGNSAWLKAMQQWIQIGEGIELSCNLQITHKGPSPWLEGGKDPSSAPSADELLFHVLKISD